MTVPQEKWEALHTAVQAPEYIKQAAQELDKSIDQAKAKAKDILSQATAEKNDTIAKAQDIVRQKDYILKEAQEMANSLQKQCDELQARKEQLEQELTQIEPYMESLEPLKAEVQELTKAKEILTGAVENEITQSKFYVPTKGFTSPDYYEEKQDLRTESYLLYTKMAKFVQLLEIYRVVTIIKFLMITEPVFVVLAGLRKKKSQPYLAVF